MVARGTTSSRRHRLANSASERAAIDERWQRIREDAAIVGEWAEAARGRLRAGDPSEALCLGRDLHWCSFGVAPRAQLACELLEAAYLALGRPSLAAIARAHHLHRELRTVDVLA